MRGRAAFLFLSLLIAVPVVPQCTFQKVASAQFRSTLFDVYADGNDLWTATSYGVSLLDRGVDPPKIAASIAVAGPTRLVRASGGIAYAASGTSIAVIRKNGKKLELVRTIDAGATINDLLLTANHLYVATANGLAQYDLLDRTNPSKTSATFATSATNVTSLALLGSTLWAADGDSSVESFDITLPQSPQKLSSLESLARSTTVHVNNGKLYVSDALQSDVFSGSVKTATVPFPTTSLAPVAGDVFFAAGSDRRIRAYDLTTVGNPIELFREDTPPSAGNVNRINALVSAGARLYVAAGDGGLVTYDISGFVSPFALRSYTTSSSATSIVSIGSAVYLTPASGGVTEYTQTPAGALTQARTWDSANADVVRDGSDQFLLTTSGAKATLWALTATIPTAISTATFNTSVRSAVLAGTKAIAVLTNGTLATADMAQASPTPQTVTIAGATALDRIVRSGSAVAISQINVDAGTTTIYYFGSPALAGTPLSMTVPGIVGALALKGSTAAAFSFPGIQLLDFAAGTTSVIPQSNSAAARGLAYAGTTIVELTSTSVILWNATTKTMLRQYALPADGVALHVADGTATLADVITSAGVTSVNLASTSKQPSAYTAPSGNAFYKKVVAAPDRVYLFSSDGRSVDFYSAALHYRGGIRSAGLVDIAANARGVFTLNASSVVTAYSPDGAQLAQATVATESDVQPLGIATAGDAVWVSISRGCLSGGCEYKTLILDPRTLAQTSSLNGGTTDLALSGTTAYAIFDLPAEVRVYDVSDPLHPSQSATRAAEGTKAPAAISFANGTIYVLGERLYSYAPQSLANIGTQLDSFTPVINGNVYADQRVRSDGGCSVVTGRSFAPQLYTTANPAAWSSAGSFDSPSLVRSVATIPGTMYLLTDHSLEVWSTSALPKPPRREAVGR